MNYASILKSDIELIADYQVCNDNAALESLLERHSNLLRKLAHNYQASHPHTIFEDCYSNAVYGAILAFKRFSKDFNVKLSTYLHSSVYFYLLNSHDFESFISCPSNLREIKSYVAGKWSDEKRAEFEKKHNLNNKEDILNFKKKYFLLSNSISLSDNLPDVEISNENETIQNLSVKIFLDTLSAEDRQIVSMLMEGYSVAKIARIFSETQRKISDKQIKKKLQTMQEKIVQYYYE